MGQKCFGSRVPGLVLVRGYVPKVLVQALIAKLRDKMRVAGLIEYMEGYFPGWFPLNSQSLRTVMPPMPP